MNSLDFLLLLQNMRSPVGDVLFTALSWLGSETAYMLLLTFVYLCVSHRFGFQLFVIFLATAFLNGELKLWVYTARPFVAHPGLIHPLYVASAEGPSFPSGHVQNAAAVWGLMAVRTRDVRARIAMVALVVLIGFSRLYLGLHWPADVIGALFVGGGVVVAYLLVVGGLAQRTANTSPAVWAVTAAMGSGLMLAAGAEVSVCVQSAGALLGAVLGYLLLEAHGGYCERANPLGQVAKMVAAMAVLMGVRVVLKVLLGASDPVTFLRYALIGFTCSYVLPAMFRGFQHPAQSESEPEAEAEAPA